MAYEPAPPTTLERGKERARRAARGDRGLVLLGIVGALVIATVLAFLVGRSTNDSTADPIERSSPLRILPIQRAGDFDPQGDDNSENSDQARLAIDDKLTTGWPTSTYLGQAKLGGLKDGVGLVLDLGGPREVDSVRVRLAGTPTSFSIYVSPSDTTKVPGTLRGLRRVAVLNDAGTDATVSLDSGILTRYVVVWLRSVPEVQEGQFRGEIREVDIRGRS